MLKLFETLREDGSFDAVSLDVRDGAIVLVDDRGAHALPDGAIAAVMKRYGKELDDARVLEGVAADARLVLPGGATLARFRHKTIFDVIAKDYLAYEAPGQVPVCELATAISAALSHLSRAAEARGR